MYIIKEDAVMYDFLRYVLWELKNSLLPVALVGVLAGAVLAVTAVRCRRRGRKFPWARAIGWLALAFWLAVTVYATVLRHSGGWRAYNLHLFRAWREVWNDFSFKSWANVLLNIALFCPLGFLLPLLWKKMRSWYLSVPLGLGVSLLIELVQLALKRGICDVDDLLANTLGTVLGWLGAMCLLALTQKLGRKVFFRRGVLTAALVLAILSPFPIYALAEYGNLPQAPACRVDTGSTQWQLDCQLPEAVHPAETFRTRALDRTGCRDFALSFCALTESTVDYESYYQEGGYYHLKPRGILQVFYHDGSWEYSEGYYGPETLWPVLDRQTVEKALEPFSVSVPACAEFSAGEDGWYSFTCHMYREGDTLVDGTLRVRCTENGEAAAIEHHLIRYEHYEQVEILTPEEAWDRLCAGYFNDDGFFEHVWPESVAVTGCSLEYAVDTKGFYQPVYRFRLSDSEGEYACEPMIPAMK